jgi:hypothetical protein
LKVIIDGGEGRIKMKRQRVKMEFVLTIHARVWEFVLTIHARVWLKTEKVEVTLRMELRLRKAD